MSLCSMIQAKDATCPLYHICTRFSSQLIL